jgi:uncharacterized protein
LGSSNQHVGIDATEGVTPIVLRALGMFAERVAADYGQRVSRLVVFGSRARGSATRESDVDVAVVLEGADDLRADRDRLSDMAYDVLVETGEELQPWPVSTATWENPDLARNPVLIRAMKRDGIDVATVHDSRPVYQGR